MLHIVTAAHSSFEDPGPAQNCETLSDDIHQLACQWRSIVSAQSDTEKFDQITDEWEQVTTKVSASDARENCLMVSSG